MNNYIGISANDKVADAYKVYATYVLETRALPQVNDGLKLVQRRILYAANKQPQKLMKTAALAGRVMELHPHGDCSGSIYSMSNPCNHLKIFNIKGNHGGPSWGPAASRYTELYLNEAGRFNYCKFVDYAEYEQGELGIDEPKSLPCLIPYALMEGASGMGVGLSTDIMPLNVMDLIEYYKDVILTGKSDRLVRPDIGDYVIHNTDDLRSAIESPKHTIRTNPIISREGNSLSFTTLNNKGGLDNVFKKLGWPLSDGYIEYRNESTSVGRHVFTVVNDKNGEVSVENVLSWLTNHTRNTGSYCRTMVDENKSAVYCTLSYVVNESLKTLNKAIDKMIKVESDKIRRKLDLYIALEKAKELHLFDGISKKSTDQVVNDIVSHKICDEVLAREIVKKPISYLTRDHNGEMDELREQLKWYENHNRTEYLINLYDEFKELIKDDFYSKSHSILVTEFLKRPMIRLSKPDELEVYEGKGKRSGIELSGLCFLVRSDGFIQPMYVESRAYKRIPLDHEFIGIITGSYKYIELQTKSDKKGISVLSDDIKYAKHLINLEDNEEVVKVLGWNDDAPDRVKNNVVTKKSKARWY